MPTQDPTKPKGDIWVKLDDKKNGRLSFKLSVSSDISKYFKNYTFFVKYDRDIGNIDESILYIPAIANIAPVSWAVGANIHVRQLDKTFIEALGTIKDNMKGMYPDFSCAGDILVEKVVSNRFGHKGAAQLFTGGVDSIATYARHREEKPDLISVGVYTPISGSLQSLIYEKLSEFAHKEGVAFHSVESNLNDFFNQRSLLSDHGQNLHEASWWASVQHGLGLLGLCAPLTAARDIQKIYIASSMSKGLSKKPWKSWGSHPLIDDNVAWADVKAFHDGLEWSRQEKIKYAIKPYVENTDNHPTFIVCNDPHRGNVLNCGRCEKCSRTIAGLALEGIDPNLGGFNVDDRTFGHIKQKLLLRRLRFTHKQPNMWRDIQACIPDRIASDMYGSKAFFEWLRAFEVRDDWNKNTPLSQNVLELFMKFGII